MKISLEQINKQLNLKKFVIAVFKDDKNTANHPFLADWSEADRKILASYIETEFSAEFQETRMFYLSVSKNGKSEFKKIVLLGLGEKEKWTLRRLILAVRKMALFAKNSKVFSFDINLADFLVKGENQTRIIQLIAENLEMADFEFNQYKKEPKEGWPKLKEIKIFSDKKDKKLGEALKQGEVVGNWTNQCRILANTPGGDMTPALFVAKAKEFCAKTKIKLTVLEEKEMEKLGMGGILGVSKGSSEKPKMVVLEYKNGGSKKNIALVGKGLTFDSGGISIKSRKGLVDMHLDMSGGAAVLGAVLAADQLSLPINLVGIVPLAENMPSGSSYRPGDLLKSMSGKIIEVADTDAEGRIILADALTYAQKFKPEIIIDIATLTGASVVALGYFSSCLFSNNKALEKSLFEAGEKSGDQVWPFPLFEEFENAVKGKFGDVLNVGKHGYDGGAIDGAAFLYQFVKDAGVKWAHIDIGSTVVAFDDHNLSKGATGAGARILVEFLKQTI